MQDQDIHKKHWRSSTDSLYDKSTLDLNGKVTLFFPSSNKLFWIVDKWHADVQMTDLLNRTGFRAIQG